MNSSYNTNYEIKRKGEKSFYFCAEKDERYCVEKPVQNANMKEAGCEKAIDFSTFYEHWHVSTKYNKYLRTYFHDSKAWFNRHDPCHDNFDDKHNEYDDEGNRGDFSLKDIVFDLSFEGV